MKIQMTNSQIMLQKLCFSFVFAILLNSSSLTAATKLRLIHYDSVSSLFHKSKLSFNPYEDIRSPLSPDKGQTIFLVNVSIGTPPVPQLLSMDTGSSLTWVCTTCGADLGPVFNPKRSSTYKTIICSSSYECFNYRDQSHCRGSQCLYQIRYFDGSYSKGVLATEKFTFETSSEGLVELSNTLFGSGLDNKWKDVDPLQGVFGLKPYGQHSLLEHVGNKFSYCLGNVTDPSYMHNQLILGDGAKFEGTSTPIRKIGFEYLVNLEGISIGGEALQVDPKEFGYNSLIDTGTTSTILTRGLFDPLKEKITKLLDHSLQQVKYGKDDLCYSGNLVRDLKGFPTVTLHFGGGADLDLNVEALFRQVKDDTFCLGMDPSTNNGNVIGIYAQQFHNFGFDMKAMTVSIQYIDCNLFED